jgi:uncharacterized protein (TIGR02145 family)
MKATKLSLVAASFALALAFTFSGCSGDDGGGSGDEPNTGGGVSSSSVGGGTPSSSGGGSSSSNGSTGGVYECDPDGTNPTIPIGNQIWMKCNLNVPHNEGNGNSLCYEGSDNSTGSIMNITAEQGCAKYGRLYDWVTAMNLPSKCNSFFGDPAYANHPAYSQYYDSDCAVSSPVHRGLCPVGFHIPTDEEWDILVKYVDQNWTSNESGGNIAGIKLKAVSGWFVNNGTDEHNFSALPSGSREMDGKFLNAGSRGHWWSASVSNTSFSVGMDFAYTRNMRATNENVERGDVNKSTGLSVRCIKDN